MNSIPITEAEQSRTFEHLGRLLYLTQLTEFLLRSVLKAAGIREPIYGTDGLAADKKTLGMLMNELRSVAALHKYFDEDLRGLLEQRNEFIHGLVKFDWFPPKTQSEDRQTWGWLAHYQQSLYEVQTVFIAYLELHRGKLSSKVKKEIEEIREEACYPELNELIKPRR